MTTIDSTFHMTDFQLDSIIGEEDEEGRYFLIFWGEGIALELRHLDIKNLDHIILEIEDSMQRTEEDRKEHQVEELLYQAPEPRPNNLRFVFCDLANLQALYQPPDALWQMVFEDDVDESQCHVMMSTRQVESLLQTLKEKVSK